MSKSYEVLDREHYENEVQDAHDRVFKSRLLEHDDLCSPPFAPDWNTVLLPFGLGRISRGFYRSLTDAVSVCGDSRIYILDAESVEPDPEKLGVTLLDASFDAFRAAISGEMYSLAHIDSHMFGASGEWGVVGAESLDGILYVAGRPGFLQRFFKEVGAERKLMKRFMDFATNGWRMKLDLKHQVLSSVGWEQGLST